MAQGGGGEVGRDERRRMSQPRPQDALGRAECRASYDASSRGLRRVLGPFAPQGMAFQRPKKWGKFPTRNLFGPKLVAGQSAEIGRAHV